MQLIDKFTDQNEEKSYIRFFGMQKLNAKFILSIQGYTWLQQVINKQVITAPNCHIKGKLKTNNKKCQWPAVDRSGSLAKWFIFNVFYITLQKIIIVLKTFFVR